jgi:hypothetical protein
MSLWLNMTGPGTSGAPRLVEKPEMNFIIVNGGSQVAFGASRSTSGGQWFGDCLLLGAGWRHVAVTYDGTSTANDPVMYVDGIPTTVTENSSPSGSLRSNSGTTYLGDRPSLGRPFEGLLDDVRIYNRVLSPSEVQALHQLGQ